MTKTSAYLIIGKPDGRTAPPTIRAVRKNRPPLGRDEIAIKVVVDIPWEVWAEFTPEVLIEVAAPQVFPPVVAYAEDAPEPEPERPLLPSAERLAHGPDITDDRPLQA